MGKSLIKHKEMCHISATTDDLLEENEAFVPSMVNPTQSENLEENISFSIEASCSQVAPSSLSINDSSTILPCSSIETVTTNSKFDYTVYRQSTRKARKSLEDIVQNLVSMKYPVKNLVATNYVNEIKKVITRAPVQSVYEGIVVNGVLDHLNALKASKKYSEMHQLLHKMFGEHTSDIDFMCFLAKKLNINHVQRFFESAEKWRNCDFTKRAPNSVLLQESKQLVYDTWLSNTVVSTDRQNEVRMRKRVYVQKFNELSNSDINIEEVRSKRNILYVSAKRLIATCTVRTIHEKVKASGISVSLGTVLSLKPFFIGYPTERELSLCLCKLCLNVRLMHEALMKRARQDGEDTTPTPTSFYTYNTPCPRVGNGYFSWSCVSSKCKQCNTLKPFELKC